MRFSLHGPNRARQMASKRLPPQPIAFPVHEFTVVDALIEGLGDLRYAAATDALLKLRGTDYEDASTRALTKIDPERVTIDLLTRAKDKKLDSFLRERALVSLCNLSLTNRVREIVTLLDDITPIVYERPIKQRLTVRVTGFERPSRFQE